MRSWSFRCGVSSTASNCVMNIYWYAPFDNANELCLAEHVWREGDHLIFHSLRTRFGAEIAGSPTHLELVRDLPEPAGDDGSSRSLTARTRVAAKRAAARHRL